MGEMNNAIVNYLSNKRRFADFINAEVYGGRQIIKPDGLTEISSTTYRKEPESDESKVPKRKEGRGDIVMRYEDDRIYRLILMEAQEKISYVLPIRSMEYLLAQYQKQISELIDKHRQDDDYGSIDERFSGINREDRLKPEYIIWLYHGEKTWDGSRSLKDMMDFGDDSDGFSGLFQNFDTHLVCVNELKDTASYTTELRKLLDLLIASSHGETLNCLIREDERFHSLDEETYETASILLRMPSIWKNRMKYVSDEGGRNYNMCKGLEEIIATEIQGMEIQIEQKDAQIEQKDAQIELKEAQIEQKDAQIELKDAQIENLQKEVALLRAQLADVKA